MLNLPATHGQVLKEYQRLIRQGSEYDRKHVYRIQCGDCDTILTDRGMNAVLLSDRSVQLFSTDLLPDTVAFVHGDYAAASCACRVRDVACKVCGNVVGYHVNVPCKQCLAQPNNGHYWMFRSSQVNGQPILFEFLSRGNSRAHLLWGFVLDAGDFSGTSFRNGDDEAAKKSCQLAVRFIGNVELIVQKPTLAYVTFYNFHDRERTLRIYYPCLR